MATCRGCGARTSGRSPGRRPSQASLAGAALDLEAACQVGGGESDALEQDQLVGRAAAGVGAGHQVPELDHVFRADRAVAERAGQVGALGHRSGQVVDHHQVGRADDRWVELRSELRVGDAGDRHARPQPVGEQDRILGAGRGDRHVGRAQPPPRPTRPARGERPPRAGPCPRGRRPGGLGCGPRRNTRSSRIVSTAARSWVRAWAPVRSAPPPAPQAGQDSAAQPPVSAPVRTSVSRPSPSPPAARRSRRSGAGRCPSRSAARARGCGRSCRSP